MNESSVVTKETEIKDGDAYKDELLDYEEGGEKAPYSAAMSANGNFLKKVGGYNLVASYEGMFSEVTLGVAAVGRVTFLREECLLLYGRIIVRQPFFLGKERARVISFSDLTV